MPSGNASTVKKTKKSKLSGLDKFLIMLLVLVFLAIVVVGGFLVFYTPDTDNDPFGDDTDVNGMPVLDESGAGKKQRQGVYNFLVVGCDKVSRSTDIMMLISYDVNGNTIGVVQIPRDTYITVDNINSSKINASYAAYYNRAKKAGSDDPEMAALSNLASMISKNFGVRINYAAMIGIDGFVNIIDIIGGVYIDVPYDMEYSDPAQDLYINLKKGPQWLDGDKAMQFVRYRKGYVQQDIGRQDAMKIFMSAVLLQVKNNFSVSMVVDIAAEIMTNMRTTIGAADFVYFGKSALSVDLSKVYMVTLPGAAATANGASVYVLYREDTADIINKYLNVYETEFKKDDFDPYGVMTSDEKSVADIYNMPLGTAEYTVYNAGDVNENSINIPTK